MNSCSVKVAVVFQPTIQVAGLPQASPRQLCPGPEGLTVSGGWGGESLGACPLQGTGGPGPRAKEGLG